MGSFCSIFLLLMISTYTFQRIEVYRLRSDVQVFQSISNGFYDDEYVFGVEEGLNIAVAFTGYDNESEDSLDLSIGRIVFRHWTWGINEQGTSQSGFYTIPSHYCSAEELGLQGSDSHMMPVQQNSFQEVTKYQKKFSCADKKDMYIHGSFNSSKARMLLL